eukprot:scaffold15319_cov56-Attheya_sp.AAC.3
MQTESGWEGEWRVKSLSYPTYVEQIIPPCGIRLTIQRNNNSTSVNVSSMNDQQHQHEFSLVLAVQNTFHATMSIRPVVSADYGGETNPIQIGPFATGSVTAAAATSASASAATAAVPPEVSQLETLLVENLPNVSKGCIMGRGHLYLTESSAGSSGIELTLEKYNENGVAVGEDPQVILQNYLAGMGIQLGVVQSNE